MTHRYKVSGMTCSGCVKQVTKILEEKEGVDSVKVDLESQLATVKMKNHISTADLNQHLSSNSSYSLKDYIPSGELPDSGDLGAKKSKWTTYKPLVLIAVFLLMISSITSYEAGEMNWGSWMHAFMAGFFLTFSFFKFLDLRGFADSYSTYDVLAKRFKAYGYIYPFLELGLGLAYLSGFFLIETYIFTILLMGFSSIGVIQSVLSKNTIQCACLGVVFNLPMSTVTIIENGLMILMAAGMLIAALG